MHMIWHDDIVAQAVGFAIIMVHRLKQTFTARFIPKDASPMTTIEEFLYRKCPYLAEFLFLVDGVRWRVEHQPLVAPAEEFVDVRCGQ